MSDPSGPVGSSATAQPTLDELRAEALAGGQRPRRWGSWYVTEHMVRAMRAYGWTIVVGVLAQPIMYLLGLVLGLAALITQPLISHGQEIPYLVFVAPALLMTAAVGVASEEFTYPVMSGFKWRRYFFGFSASPLSSAQIANGVVLGATVRMFVAVAAYYVFILLFQAVPNPATGWLTIPVALLAGLSFGVPLMAYAASVEDDKGQFALVQRFLFVPMFLFSGTFYPLENLGVLQWIGWISPLWHASELGRALTYGGGSLVGNVIHLAYLLMLVVIGYAVARRLFARRLAR